MSRPRHLLCLILLSVLRPACPAAELPEGLSYENRRTSHPLSIHVLEVRPEKLRILAARSLDEGVGRETVSSLSQRHAALAAVNAGFFTIGGRYDGEPAGILRIGSTWYSDSPTPRAALGWRAGGAEARIGSLAINWSLGLNGKSYPIDGINRARGPGECIAYTWAFHRTTLTDPEGTEVRIAGDRIVDMRRRGNSPIPIDGWVYSIGPEAKTVAEEFKRGRRVRLRHQLLPAAGSTATEAALWESMECLVGGLGLLVRSGAVVRDHGEEKLRPGFVTDRHPRTAAGLRPDGTWVLVVVDGRQPELSHGMTLDELADLMLSLGCRDALNLDGGGSSTMVLSGRIVNAPSDDGKERPVSDAILILPRP